MPTQQSHPLPPRGERFADPVARAVWAAITALPDGQQHLILDELRQQLGRLDKADSHQTRVRHAVGALRECAELLGHSPSVEDYRRLRAEHPELKWPADGSLRGWLGGHWNKCLSQAQLAEVTDGDVIIAQQGAALTKDEVCKALADCAKELGEIPTYHRYLSWARQPAVQALPGRRPTSQSPFDRLFEGFRNALVASGLIDESLDGLPRSSRVRFGSYFVSREACIDALKEVAESIGHAPRVREYAAARESLIIEPLKPGQKLRSLPATSTIQKEFGMWDAALVAAGLNSLGGRATGARPGPRERKGSRIKKQEIVSCLVEAYLQPDVGEPFTGAAYRAWRQRQIECDRAARRLRLIPSYDSVWTWLGSWTTAIAIVYRAIEMQKTTAEAIEQALPALLDGLAPPPSAAAEQS